LHAAVSTRLLYDKITFPGNKIVYYQEGASDTVAVVERPKEGDRNLIYGDGRGAAATSTLPWNRYFGHLPMLLHPHPKEVLHICYGSGNSVRAVTRHDPERIDVIELSPHVRGASPFFWTNEGAIDDPRVNLIIEDGRNFVLGTERTYDVISLEPPSIYTAGVVNLYTEEFYELCRRRLRPDGVMMQWFPTAELTDEARGSMMRAFADAFPAVTVWQQLQSSTLLMVGTLKPLAVDVDVIERRLQTETMRKDMQAMGLQDAYGFLSLYLLSDEATRKLVQPFAPVRDDRTVVDYSIPKFVGAGFGFGPYAYAIGDPKTDLGRLVFARLGEYAQWHAPAATIVPDPQQARLLDEGIQMRMSGPATAITRAACQQRLASRGALAH
jgi:hypothetical protein